MENRKSLQETPIQDQTVFRGLLFDVSHMQVRLPDGTTALREIVHHNGGVGVVAVDEEGLVTLVHQHRIAIDAITLEIPAGKLDSKEEDPLSAAKRELEEETGLQAETFQWLTTSVATPGYCTEKLHLYLATGLSQHQAHLDPGEFLQVVKMPLNEALQRVMAGEIPDAKTALGLLMAKERLANQGKGSFASSKT